MTRLFLDTNTKLQRFHGIEDSRDDCNGISCYIRIINHRHHKPPRHFNDEKDGDDNKTINNMTKNETVRRCFSRAVMTLLVVILAAMTAEATTLNGVSYIDADGATQTADNVTVLTDEMTELSPGWYVVNSTVDYSSTVTLDGEGAYHLILADGGQMNIETWADNVRGIYGTDATLTIYGQTNGTGELNVYTSGYSGHAIVVDDLTINGGKITAKARGEDASGLWASNNVTINGGVITATATGDGESFGIRAERVIINSGQVTVQGSNKGICSDCFDEGGISLSWKNTTDFIDANSYYLSNDNSSLTIAAGKAFTDGNGHYYTAANAEEVVSLTNTKLSPAQAYTVTFDSNGGSDVPIQAVPAGHTVTEPTPPTKAGKVFCGWYMDSGLLAPYDFTWAVTGNLNLYAKWADAISHNLSDATIQRIYRYTGSAVTPIVRDNAGQLLTAGTHYTVSYAGATQMREPGVYTLTVTGKGSYTGSQTASVRVLTFEQYDGTSLVTSTLPANNDNAVVVTSSTTAMASACWYVVSEDVTVAERIRVDGDVNLVLCGGATLTAEQGISVTDGHSLTIYSQSGNTGALVATVSNDENVGLHAAIGGDRYRNPITVFDPPVKAGTITIHGGVINATANITAAGIGEAYEGGAGTINIYGGKITARCGTSGTSGTGIGGTGATVHLGWCRETDDFIEAQGFIGNVIFDKAFLLDGTNFLATAENCAGQKMVPAAGTFYTVTFQTNGGSTVVEQYILSGQTVAEPDKPLKAGYQFAGWYANEGCSGSAYDFTAAVTSSFTLYAKWDAVAPISYIDADGQTVTGFTDYILLEDIYTELPAGTYFVGKNVTVSSRINLNGTVNLILGDGKTLTAEEGIHVADNSTLNIFQQSEGTGALTASSSTKYHTAIGRNGDDDPKNNANTICIYGGIITANGADASESVAIGGTNNRPNGDIFIYGGTVTANAGHGGIAIGGLYDYFCGTINILGGKITANSDNYIDHGIFGIGSPNGTIHLGWSRLDDDFIQSSVYCGTVIFDKSFVLGSNDGIEANSGNIAGEKLVPNNIPFYDVSFDTNGAGAIASQHIKGDGRPVVQPEAPVKLGHAFEGWYTDEEFSGSPYEFTGGVTSDFTLYAKWRPIPYALNVPACFEATVGGSAATTATIGQEVTLRKIVGYRLTSSLTVTDADNATLDVSNAGNGCYTFTMPASEIIATAEYTDMFDVINGADGSADQPYVISSTAGWNYFCDLLAEYDKGVLTGKTVTLGGDIPTAEEIADGTTAVTSMAGSESHDFTGTFDGGGYTLTVGYANTDNGARTAPFSYVDGATISNLVVDGSITGSAYRAAGGVGETGTTTSHITNCASSLTISSDRYTGGFSIGGNVEIEGCVFNGTIKGSNMSGGFVGYSNSALKITNCLFAPQDGSSIVGGTFYYNGDADITPVNSYYTEALGDAQGKAVRSITAGENVTCEVLPVGDATETYSVSGITAYAEGIIYGDTFYYGSGDEVSLTLSHAERDGYTSAYEVNAGTLSGTENPYSLAMPDDADVTVTVTFEIDPAHFAVNADGTEYTIKTAKGWNVFCDLLAENDKGYFTGKTVTLGGNIPTAEEIADGTTAVTRMAGSSNQDFTGTFDGGGYTLTFGYSGSLNDAAPILYMDGGRIENLRVAGTIETSAKYAAGLIAHQFGNVTIRNCRSSVVIRSSVNGDGNHGGFVAQNHNAGDITIEGCLFDGKLLTTNGTTCCGGFVGWRSGNTEAVIKVKNSLYAPAALDVGENWISSSESATFVRNGIASDITNSYYTSDFNNGTSYTAQGKHRRSIAAGENVTVSHAGETIEYSVSGITAYKGSAGIVYDEVLYAGADEEVSLTLSHAERVGYTFSGYTASAGTLDGSTLTMPDEDVTLNAEFEPNTYTITDVSGTDAQGTLGFYSDETCNTAITVAEVGATVYIKVTPNSGYQLSSIMAQCVAPCDGADSRRSESLPIDETVDVTPVAGTTDVYELTMPNCNVEVKATWERIPVILPIGNGGWATYYHEDGVTYSVSGGTAYYVSSIGEGVVNLTAIDGVPTGLPVLISGTPGKSVTLAETATAVEVTGNDPQFKGTATGLSATDFTDFVFGRTYVLYGGRFMLVETNGGIGAHKCWLTLTAPTTARQLNISVEGATNLYPSIIAADESTQEGGWYDLQGRKLSDVPTKQGIYIFKGKKVKR